MSGLEEYVVRFDISVEYVMIVEGPKGVDELSEDDECFFFREGSFVSEQVFQGSSFAELVDEVDVVVAFDHFYEVDNVDVVFEGSQGFYLVFCEFG